MFTMCGTLGVGGMKVAFFSFGACEGCRYGIVNEFPKVAKLLEKYDVEIVREPLLSVMSEEEYDIAIIEGAITSLDINKIKEIREKAKVLVALGSCSYLGGIATLGYRYGVHIKEYLDKGYSEGDPVWKYVKVDGYVRGCPAYVDDLISLLEEYIQTGSIKRYERRFGFEKDTDLILDDGFLRLDTKKCIVCGRCTEICSLVYANVLTNSFRGFKVIVTTPAQESFLDAGCIRCGLCAAYCPVGAIKYRSDIEEAKKIIENRGVVFIERYALDSLANDLKITYEKIISLLETLGFSDVKIIDFVDLINNDTGIVPFSSAEKRFVMNNFPDAIKYLLDYPKFSLSENAVLITNCVARKEDHVPTLTVDEFIKIVKGMHITLEDLPDKRIKLNSDKNDVNIVKGPRAVHEAVEEFLKNPKGILVLQICPGGCSKGSGSSFAQLDVI